MPTQTFRKPKFPHDWGRCGVMILVGCLAFCTVAAKRPVIEKLGTIAMDMVETTPVFFKDRLYLYQWNRLGDGFRFIDMTTGRPTPQFAPKCQLGSAIVVDDTVYAFGVYQGSEIMKVFWSKDLVTWQEKVAFNLPGWKLWNNSVCNGPHGYVMAVEVDHMPEQCAGWTQRFAVSKDLRTWEMTPPECYYGNSRDGVAACAALRFFDGYYYMISMARGVWTKAPLVHSYYPEIERSRDLIHWERSPLNPFMMYSIEDRKIADPNLGLTAKDCQDIANPKYLDNCNSDVDLCEYAGQTIIFYFWGDQETGRTHLGKAIYKGPMKELLNGFFPQGP